MRTGNGLLGGDHVFAGLTCTAGWQLRSHCRAELAHRGEAAVMTPTRRAFPLQQDDQDWREWISGSAI